MSTKISVIDTSAFNKLPDGYKQSSDYVPKRFRIPLYVQSQVAAALPYDTRRLGEKPPKLDIYTSLLDLGLRAAQEEAEQKGEYHFTGAELSIPETPEDVIWIPRETVDVLNVILRDHNWFRSQAGMPKLTGTAPIICALLRRGISQCNVITKPTSI